MHYVATLRTNNSYAPYVHTRVKDIETALSYTSFEYSRLTNVWRFHDEFGLERDLVARFATYNGI